VAKGGRLTDQQEAFCLAYVANGRRNATKCYMEVFGCDKDSAESGASRVLGYAKVQEYLAKLGEKTNSPKVLSITERKEILSEIAQNGRDGERIRAIDVLNQMDSVYVQKQEVKMDNVPIVIHDDVPLDD
jgi:phage terminase small subunit